MNDNYVIEQRASKNRINEVCAHVRIHGCYESKGFDITASKQTSEIWVHQRIAGSVGRRLVAYSSTEIDCEAALEEFVGDFFV